MRGVYAPRPDFPLRVKLKPAGYDVNDWVQGLPRRHGRA